MKIQLLHSGNERRQLNRLSIDRSNEFFGIIKYQEKTQPAKIVDFHSEGIGLLVEKEVAVLFTIGTTLQSFEIYYGKRKLATLEEPKVMKVSSAGRISLSFSSSERTRGLRTVGRLKVRGDFHANLIAQDPWKMDTMIHMSLIDISSSGFLLETSLSNKHLLQGMTLKDVTMILPGVNVITLTLRVAHVKHTAGRLRVGVTLVDPSSHTLVAISQFAIFGTIHEAEKPIDIIHHLEKADLKAKKLGNAARISSVSNAEEYAEVLKIRLDAYRAAEKVPTGFQVEDMADSFDDRSIILLCRVGGKIVATVRLVEGDQKSPFPFESLFPISALGENKTREHFYEVSKLAILPEYQGTDILLKLFKEVARQTIINKRSSVCLSTRAIKKNYEIMGFKKITEEVPHPTLKQEFLALFRVNADEFIDGQKMSALAWEKVAKSVVNHLAENSFIARPRRKISHLIMRNIESIFLKIKKKRAA